MLSLTAARLSDVHGLNYDFLNLCRDEDFVRVFGIDPELCREISSIGEEIIEKISHTDVLLFDLKDENGIVSGESARLPAHVSAFLQKLSLVIRDVGRTDVGLAAAHFGIDSAKCKKLINMTMDGAMNYYVTARPKIRAVGTTAFRILPALASPSERTQFVTLAANDD